MMSDSDVEDRGDFIRGFGNDQEERVGVQVEDPSTNQTQPNLVEYTVIDALQEPSPPMDMDLDLEQDQNDSNIMNLLNHEFEDLLMAETRNNPGVSVISNFDTDDFFGNLSDTPPDPPNSATYPSTLNTTEATLVSSELIVDPVSISVDEAMAMIEPVAKAHVRKPIKLRKRDPPAPVPAAIPRVKTTVQSDRDIVLAESIGCAKQPKEVIVTNTKATVEAPIQCPPQPPLPFVETPVQLPLQQPLSLIQATVPALRTTMDVPEDGEVVTNTNKPYVRRASLVRETDGTTRSSLATHLSHAHASAGGQENSRTRAGQAKQIDHQITKPYLNNAYRPKAEDVKDYRHKPVDKSVSQGNSYTRSKQAGTSLSLRKSKPDIYITEKNAIKYLGSRNDSGNQRSDRPNSQSSYALNKRDNISRGRNSKKSHKRSKSAVTVRNTAPLTAPRNSDNSSLTRGSRNLQYPSGNGTGSRPSSSRPRASSREISYYTNTSDEEYEAYLQKRQARKRQARKRARYSDYAAETDWEGSGHSSRRHKPRSRNHEDSYHTDYDRSEADGRHSNRRMDEVFADLKGQPYVHSERTQYHEQNFATQQYYTQPAPLQNNYYVPPQNNYYVPPQNNYNTPQQYTNPQIDTRISGDQIEKMGSLLMQSQQVATQQLSTPATTEIISEGFVPAIPASMGYSSRTGGISGSTEIPFGDLLNFGNFNPDDPFWGILG
jgi:hypothetical protein